MSARYVPLVKIASGGMATVYVGTSRGDLGFRRLVAIKRPHPHLAEDPDFRAALLEEAHVAARVRHAHVVDVQDVEVAGDDVQLVMDYVEGATLAQLLGAASKRGEKLPARVALRIALDACAGLAAVHEARDEHGAPLGLVHRDVSPQNILVGLDGLARISDFGTAKSALSGRPSTTQGTLKGKLAYMAPEYVGRGRLDRRVDVFAMGVVLWESLAGKRLFRGANDADTLDRVQREEAPLVGEIAPELGTRLDAILARALVKRPEERWANAEELGAALAEIAQDSRWAASHADVARVVREAVEPELEARRSEVRVRLAALDAAPALPGAPPPASTPSPAGGATPIAAATPLPVRTQSVSDATRTEDSAAQGQAGATTPASGATLVTPGAPEDGEDRTVLMKPGVRPGRRWLFVALALTLLAAAGGARLLWSPGGDSTSKAAPPSAETSVVSPAASMTARATATAALLEVSPAGTAPPATTTTAPTATTATSTEATSAPPPATRPTPPAPTPPPAAPPVSGKRKAPPNPYGPG